MTNAANTKSHRRTARTSKGTKSLAWKVVYWGDDDDIDGAGRMYSRHTSKALAEAEICKFEEEYYCVHIEVVKCDGAHGEPVPAKAARPQKAQSAPAVEEAPAASLPAFTKRTNKNPSGTVFAAQYTIWYAKDGRFGTPYSEWKRVAPQVSASASFISHLCKNWTVEDYFAALDAGECPLEIVKRTGYLSPRIQRWLRDNGYPATPAGMAAFADATNARDA